MLSLISKPSRRKSERLIARSRSEQDSLHGHQTNVAGKETEREETVDYNYTRLIIGL